MERRYPMSQPFNYQNGEQYYNRLHLIFNGLIAVSLFPFAIVYLELDRGTADEPLLKGMLSQILSFLFPAIVAVMIVLTFKRYRNGLKQVENLETLRSKLDLYYGLSINKYLILGAASRSTMVAYYLTQSSIFIVVYVFALIAYSLGRPTISVIIEDCRLSKEERKVLEEKLPIP
ncbi:MAG: hypothetical protein AAGC88_17230 [Bacteroidota bacterium]